MPTEEELKPGYRLGEWEILPDHGVLRRGQEEVRPEPLTWRVLTSLARRDGSLVTRDDLIEDAWFGRAVSDDPINRAIAQVRKALGDDARNPSYVETLQRRGYRLLQPVELLQSAEPDADVASDPTRPAGLKRWKFAAGIFALFFAVSIWLDDLVALFGPSDVSVGVMPFENESPEGLDEYIVAGFKMELIASLAAVNGLTVRNIRQVEAREQVEVELELEAYVRLVDDELSVRYLIVNADGEHQHDGIVGGGVDDLYALQEKLAVEVSEKLGGKRQQQLIKTQPTDSIAYDSYMRGVYELENRGDRDNLADAISLFQNSIELDNGYGPAYLGLATAYALMVDYFDAPVGEYNQLALDTIKAGVKADASIEDAAESIYGFVFHKEKRWQDSEDAHRRAVEGELVDANAFNWYSRMLASVGRLEAAVVQAETGVELDPSWGVINSRLAMSHTWVANDEKAHEYFARSNSLGAGGVTHDMGYSFLLLRDGAVDEARERTREGVRSVGAREEWIDPVFDALSDQSLAPAALELLAEFETDRQIAPQASLVIRTGLGDIDGAMRVARLLELPGEVFEIELLFVPEMAPLRQHPDFMPLLERLGIVDYWQQNDCVFEDDQVRCD